MTAAIFGLVGVLVGGAITFATELALERRRERATRKRALRLVCAELEMLSMGLRAVGQTRTPDPAPPTYIDMMLPVTAWNEYGPVLADALPKSQWDLVVAIYTEAAVARSTVVDKETVEALASIGHGLFAAGLVAEELVRWLQADPPWREGQPRPDALEAALAYRRQAGEEIEVEDTERAEQPDQPHETSGGN